MIASTQPLHIKNVKKLHPINSIIYAQDGQENNTKITPSSH